MEWAFRCEYENKKHLTGCFITLTYSDDNINYITNSEGELVQTLVKSDFQKFMKRLRKENEKHTPDKIRFFACGEYGETTKRPHYHALIWSIDNKTKKVLSKLWTLGFIKIGDINGKSIRYVTNYMMKKNVEAPRGAQPYFTLMSRNKGIGYDYVEDNRTYYDFHEENKMCTPDKYENRPYLSEYYTKHLKSTPESLKQFKEEKELHYSKLRSELEVIAELKDPKDPLGYIRKLKNLKHQKSIENQNSRNKHKIRL